MVVFTRQRATGRVQRMAVKGLQNGGIYKNPVVVASRIENVKDRQNGI